MFLILLVLSLLPTSSYAHDTVEIRISGCAKFVNSQIEVCVAKKENTELLIISEGTAKIEAEVKEKMSSPRYYKAYSQENNQSVEWLLKFENHEEKSKATLYKDGSAVGEGMVY